MFIYVREEYIKLDNGEDGTVTLYYRTLDMALGLVRNVEQIGDTMWHGPSLIDDNYIWVTKRKVL
jgi:hypothetical protein